MNSGGDKWEERLWKIVHGLLWVLGVGLASWTRDIDRKVIEFDGDHKMIELKLQHQNSRLEDILQRLERREGQ